ncbi:hypothetical protein [Pedobacter psychroterrae]|uniref:Carboxypeptidase-like protein n=1 Tax=Pedobacter psychroterrae TaxID=2530453 RepID=A0A4R0NNF7_9SPHI|nr:hypothetical protein [Pedobacter psychroterrae]TCD01173.1 hypothetical protein EZ437_10435 [Pedobacter psychroterrae]
MKRMILFLLCILTLSLKGQEKGNAIYIADRTTKLAIPSVTVAIARAKLAITTEKDGLITIPGDLKRMRDTVIFAVQTYQTVKYALQDLSGVDTIFLNKIDAEPLIGVTDARTELVLNDYDRKEIALYAGRQTETSRFECLQLAQQFEVSRAGMLLKQVVIGRLAFVLDYFDTIQRDLVGIEETTFRIRIYDVDSLTGRPGKDLCNKIIEVRDKDNRQFTVNLSPYKIAIPNKTFFVAIEWMRDFRNMGYDMVYDEKIKKEVQIFSYRPAIGISPLISSELHIWGLDFKGNWKPYTYFSPDYTDLAIKATVAY